MRFEILLLLGGLLLAFMFTQSSVFACGVEGEKILVELHFVTNSDGETLTITQQEIGGLNNSPQISSVQLVEYGSVIVTYLNGNQYILSEEYVTKHSLAQYQPTGSTIPGKDGAYLYTI